MVINVIFDSILSINFCSTKMIAIFILAAILSVAYSAPLSNEEVIHQLLSFREDLLAAEQFNHVEAKTNTLPWSLSWFSPQHSPFLHELDKNLLLIRTMEFLNMDRAKFSTGATSEAELEKNWLQVLAIKVLNELKSRATSMKEPYNSEDQNHVTPEQNKAEMNVDADTLRSNLFDCLATMGSKWVNSFKSSRRYGEHDPFFDGFLHMFQAFFQGIHANATKDALDDTMKTAFRSFISLFHHVGSDSEELVGKDQGLHQNIVEIVFKAILRNILTKLSDDNSKHSMFIKGILKGFPIFWGEKLNKEDQMAVNKSINFFFKKILSRHKFSEEVNARIKDATVTFVSTFLKGLGDEKLSTEDQRSLFNSLISLFVSLWNPETLNIDSLLEQFLLKGNDEEEISREIQNLVVTSLQKLANILSKSQIKSENGEQCAIDVMQEAILVSLVDLLDQHNTKGGSEKRQVKKPRPRFTIQHHGSLE